MIKSRMTITAMLLCAFLSTAVFGQVSSDFDKSADFSKYKTYSFAGWQDNSDQVMNDIDKKRVEEAFGSEFKARGMTYVEGDADVKVTLYLVVEDKTSTTAYTNYNGGMGYHGGFGYGYGMAGVGMASSTTTINEENYQVGTLVVDMYDESTKGLVWEGILTTTIKDPKKREKNIPKDVGKVMKNFPTKPVK